MIGVTCWTDFVVGHYRFSLTHFGIPTNIRSWEGDIGSEQDPTWLALVNKVMTWFH